MHNYKRSQAGVVAPPVAYESVIPNPKAKLLDQIRAGVSPRTDTCLTLARSDDCAGRGNGLCANGR
jgi:hypothetical protein